MPDVKQDGQQQDDKDFELQVSSEGADDTEKEELYDKDGRPLPWNQSKRFRKLYGEAKEGRKLNAQLKEIGIKPADLPRLREDLQRLEQFDAAYANYLKEQQKGTTTPQEDQEAAKAQAERNRMRKVLKELGVPLVDDEEATQAEQARQLETHKVNTVKAASNRIAELAEDAGYDLDSMSKDDRQDLMEEFDFRISKVIERNEELRSAFIEGSLRPVEKAFKQVLEKIGTKPTAKKASGIGNLPPRLSSSSAGTARQQSKVAPPPKNVKEASEQMTTELKAINAAKRASESA